MPDGPLHLPLSVRLAGSEVREKYLALREEIGPGLRIALGHFLFEALYVNGLPLGRRGQVPHVERCASLARVLDGALLPDQSVAVYLAALDDESFQSLVATDALSLMTVVDRILFLYRHQDFELERAMLRLEVAMAEARFAWRVNDGGNGIIRRLSEGMDGLLQAALLAPTAHEHIRRAIDFIHGPAPQPGPGVDAATRAVEAVVFEAFGCVGRGMTLGKLLGNLRHGTAEMAVRLPVASSAHSRAVPPLAADKLLLEILQALWHGHVERHAGAADGTVDLKAAQSLLGLAALAIDWFHRGVATRIRG